MEAAGRSGWRTTAKADATTGVIPGSSHPRHMYARAPGGVLVLSEAEGPFVGARLRSNFNIVAAAKDRKHAVVAALLVFA